MIRNANKSWTMALDESRLHRLVKLHRFKFPASDGQVLRQTRLVRDIRGPSRNQSDSKKLIA